MGPTPSSILHQSSSTTSLFHPPPLPPFFLFQKINCSFQFSLFNLPKKYLITAHAYTRHHPNTSYVSLKQQPHINISTSLVIEVADLLGSHLPNFTLPNPSNSPFSFLYARIYINIYSR